jgi:hypothetical protein
VSILRSVSIWMRLLGDYRRYGLCAARYTHPSSRSIRIVIAGGILSSM